MFWSINTFLFHPIFRISLQQWDRRSRLKHWYHVYSPRFYLGWFHLFVTNFLVRMAEFVISWAFCTLFWQKRIWLFVCFLVIIVDQNHWFAQTLLDFIHLTPKALYMFKFCANFIAFCVNCNFAAFVFQRRDCCQLAQSCVTPQG